MQTNEEQNTQQQQEPVGSRYEANPIQQVGHPWSTGLFDCHENQTNGNINFTLNFVKLLAVSVYQRLMTVTVSDVCDCVCACVCAS